MNAFEAVSITWKGAEYVVPPDRVLALIAAVEDVITLPELAAMGEARRPKVAKIAAGYGAWLRFAGCRVTDAEVFSSIYSTAVTPASAMEHIAALMSVLMPSDIRKATVEQLEKIVAAQGGLPKGKAPTRHSRSSKRTTSKSLSAPAG